MIVHLQNAKRPGLLKRNPGPLRILHCLFHLGMLFLLLFLLRQKQLDLLLHTLELLFLGIRERRVSFQCKLACISDYGKLICSP